MLTYFPLQVLTGSTFSGHLSGGIITDFATQFGHIKTGVNV